MILKRMVMRRTLCNFEARCHPTPHYVTSPPPSAGFQGSKCQMLSSFTALSRLLGAKNHRITWWMLPADASMLPITYREWFSDPLSLIHHDKVCHRYIHIYIYIWVVPCIQMGGICHTRRWCMQISHGIPTTETQPWRTITYKSEVDCRALSEVLQAQIGGTPLKWFLQHQTEGTTTACECWAIQMRKLAAHKKQTTTLDGIRCCMTRRLIVGHRGLICGSLGLTTGTPCTLSAVNDRPW